MASAEGVRTIWSQMPRRSPRWPLVLPALLLLGALIPLAAGSTSARGGQPDPTFGKDGIVMTAFGSDGAGASSVELRPGGKIVVGGGRTVPWTQVSENTAKSRL